MNALKEFTHELIDYAGLFPPAGLPIETVVKNYAEYVQGVNRHWLARLIVPAGKLAEFEQVAENLLPKSDDSQPWRISALVPPVSDENSDFKFAVSGIQQFNHRHRLAENGLALIDVVEIRTPTIEHVTQTMQQLPEDLSGFLEVPHAHDPTESISAIADNGASGRFYAKIRTGGVTPELIPPSSEVARFIWTCAEHLVGLKATAGLHHPIRGEFTLTYEADSPTGTMHGFVNVFAAICLAFGCGISSNEIQKVLDSDDASEFRFEPDGLHWQNHVVSQTRLAAIRRRFATSFGSCSFTEPTSEIVESGISGITTAAPVQTN